MLNSPDLYLNIFICFLIGFIPAKDLGLHLIRKIIILPLKLDVALFYSLYFFVILFSVKKVIYRLKSDTLWIIFFFVINFTATMLRPELQDYLLTMGLQLLLSLIILLYARSVNDFHNLSIILGWTAMIITISMFVLIIKFNINEDVNYSQYTGYLVLPAAIISSIIIIDRINIIHFLNIILSIFLMLISGARGPIGCLMLLIFIKLFWKLKASKNWKRLVLGSMLIILPAVIFANKLVSFFTNLTIEKGFSTRLLGLISHDDVLNATGRVEIKDYVVELIKNHPIIGVGLGFDRIYINHHFGNSVSEVIGDYPHNFFLELLLQYGIIIGGIIIILLFRTIVLAFKRSKNLESRNILLAFMAMGLFPLFFSGSYLNAPLFFAFLGFSLTNKNVFIG